MGWSGRQKLGAVLAALFVGVAFAVGLVAWADWHKVPEDISRAKEQFGASGIDSYTVDVSHECFGCDRQPLSITVKNGELIAVDNLPLRYLSTEDSWVEAWGPIDRGLASAASIGRNRDFRTTLRFDRSTGVPTSLSVEPGARFIGDGWVNFSWSQFRPTT